MGGASAEAGGRDLMQHLRKHHPPPAIDTIDYERQVYRLRAVGFAGDLDSGEARDMVGDEAEEPGRQHFISLAIGDTDVDAEDPVPYHELKLV